MYSLLTAAAQVPARKAQVQTFLVIDEFQRIISGNVELLLQLARSLNIGVILANQSLLDLRSGGIDLIPAISANARFDRCLPHPTWKSRNSLFADLVKHSPIPSPGRIMLDFRVLSSRDG